MKGVSVFLILGICWAQAQFLNNRPFPTYSLENMPDTEFSCRDKILGGYYADAETQCQMFHICVKVAGVGVQDFRFLCPNGTAFDQDHQICAEWEDVDCDATTLYYSSDNFDLYRLGSGFESKAVKYGEEEEPFALQRAETGDARINREHQSQRINQQKDNLNQYYKNRQSNNNNNNDREIFKGSSSSNFFNNRNNGKENDDDYDDNVNVNQNRDQVQRRKIIRNKQKRPVPQQQQNNENVTQKPARPTGFRNNFAGSSFVPTTSRPTSTTINSDQYTTAINNYRIRQRVSQNRQYNNDVPTSAPSTPAPFRQTQQYNNPPVRQQQQTTQPPKQPQQTENYPSSFAQQQYDVQKVKVSKPAVEKNEKPTTPFAKTENYPSNNPQYYNKKATTPAKQFNNDYPTTFSPKNKPTGFKPAVDTFPTTFAPKTNSGYTQIQQQTIQYNKQNNNNQFKQTTPFNAQNNQQQYNNNQNTQQYNNNQNTQQYNNNQNTQQYNNNKQTTAYNQQQYSNNQNTQQYNNNNKQTTPYNAQNNQQQYNNNKQTTPFYNQNTQQQYNNQQYNNQQFNSQKSTPQYNPSTNFNNNKQSSTPRTTPFTQYTPTVPKVTSTTPVSRSNRFDETQYDDGSYNQKYDYDGNERKEDEFLKTAHSQNIANSRNEYIKSTKVNTQQPVVTQKPYFEAPRPFSVSPNTPQKVTNNYPVTSKKPQVVQNNNKNNNNNKPVEQPKQQPVQPQKTKDVSYDYAYYDSNTGVEPDYEIDTEIKKSTVKN